MTKPTFTARTPVDLIALAPVVLGFHPEDSIVLLTFGASPGRQFHARVDLPPTDDLAEVVEVLVGPVRRHRIEVAAVLVYSDDVQLSRAAVHALVPQLEAAGCHLVDVLRVEDDCYDWPLDPTLAPQPHDIANHEFTAQAVFLGRQTMASRSEVADQLIGRGQDEIDEVRAAAMEAAEQWGSAQGTVVRERQWIRATMATWLEQPTALGAEDCGRLLHLLSVIELRDVAWGMIGDENCRDLEQLWIDLVKRSPDELVPAPAALLAFTAWLAGDGALAWCAVDRCLEQDPDYSLGHLIGGMLEQAVPPQVWSASRQARTA